MKHSSAPKRVKYFLDTEFSGTQTGFEIVPISIALVSESGREYYAECDTPWRDYASPWVMENVAPLLEEGPKSLEIIQREMTQFVGGMDCEFWAFCAAWDWALLCRIMGGMAALPSTWLPFAFDLAWLDPERKLISHLPTSNPKRHHALWDARELREQYSLLTRGR